MKFEIKLLKEPDEGRMLVFIIIIPLITLFILGIFSFITGQIFWEFFFGLIILVYISNQLAKIKIKKLKS